MISGAIGFGELILILLAAVLVLGPDKAPQTARQFGRVVREFRQTINGVTDDLKNNLTDGLDADEMKGDMDAIRRGQEASHDFIRDLIKEPEDKQKDKDE
ncbi:twin-arginine translocase TatA/TatE family subunit [Peptococcus simiae]|uniref:twin-arginine translocase TatA/TatE family subunit n=1 Tax=Peptococcus simiae TaxID=1643805 RepID=UPI003981069D